ncbi:FAD-binding oxidoreductase [Candidatus Desantisbacteria bacterium CG07_land_8_20_14_0_80_39_15]|uniref:FAD-binding oxidoreductase n=2 Tax=unclassified Candidatus Desantisiibacteriota TaxID=3106372 RepID=A0A2H9PDB3_9BACT|nr:MAG: FAD-binding oxidoreductase [Candidatus Desantisbacteria bacterium CG07_land_8_20_14_0_80_39_15]PIZ17440.1 MAG: FAD-binding oxidoreductase [Candidatus Desantisbacteria bacterium CG_4_10_14_0_8_um_filter_39_17]
MIIKKLQDEIIGYLEDSSNFCEGKAEAVYIPENEDEIVEIVKECAAKKMPLTISAGGTGTVAARIPLQGAILSIEKLNKIIGIDKEKKTATLQSGVIINDFLKALEAGNLFYPPFPTERTAFISGNISTNASGEYSYRFGSTRKYVKRIRIVLSTGRVLEIPRGKYFADSNGYIEVSGLEEKIVSVPNYISPSVKSSAGYFSRPGMDLIDLFIGSEGTLGVITEVDVELIPALPPRFIMIIFFPNEDRLLEFLELIKNGDRVSPFSLEYFDSNSLGFLKKDFPNIPECACAIYIEDEESEDRLDAWLNLIENYELVDTWMSKDEKSYREFVDFRHKLPENINEYFKKIKSTKLAIDAAVPENVFPDFFALYRSIQKESSIQTVRFGHIGENHLHFNFFPKNEDEKAVAVRTFEDILRKEIAAGGTVSAEHGIGKLKHKYLEMMYGKNGITEMVRVKKEIDPYCIFGLDNIFPAKLL